MARERARALGLLQLEERREAREEDRRLREARCVRRTREAVLADQLARRARASSGRTRRRRARASARPTRPARGRARRSRALHAHRRQSSPPGSHANGAPRRDHPRSVGPDPPNGGVRRAQPISPSRWRPLDRVGAVARAELAVEAARCARGSCAARGAAPPAISRLVEPARDQVEHLALARGQRRGGASSDLRLEDRHAEPDHAHRAARYRPRPSPWG